MKAWVGVLLLVIPAPAQSLKEALSAIVGIVNTERNENMGLARSS